MPPKSKKPRQDFPVDKIGGLLAEKFPNGTINEEATAYLASVAEYLTKEIFELSLNAARTRLAKELGKEAKKNKDVELTLNDVMRAISSDKDLRELVESTRRSEYHDRW